MKSIANYITVSRIFLVLTLFLMKPLSTAFLIIYLICGISDMVDGYIARRTGTTSKLGEKLDSAADLIMVTVLIVLLYPVINLEAHMYVWIAIIVIIRGMSILTVLIKYKTFGILHTFGNKITGFMLFLFPLLYAIIKTNVLIYVICIVASVSAVEELVIHLLSKELRANRKSLIH